MMHRPTTLDEALALLAAGSARPLAGGTDIYPARASGLAWMRPETGALLDLSALPDLQGIVDQDDHWRIGAGTTWSALRAAPLPPAFDALRDAARQVGGVQVQNRGTLAGNLCNASPAADGVPPLLALDAQVELAGPRGVRRLGLDDFLLGNRRTALAPDELLTAILVPRPSPGARSSFQKLGARAHLVISIVMVAAVVEAEGGTIRRARIAVGACSPVALRLPELEAALAGTPVGEAASRVTPAHLAALAPIDDVRATAAYRRHAALVLVRRALAEALA
jgi:N-methylhydantoinase B